MNTVAFINRDDDRHNVKDALQAVTAGRTAFKTPYDKANNIIRPNGFADWQLIYIKKGFGIFDEKRVSEGHVILYRPHMPQIYRYPNEGALDVYWVHFGGYEAESLIRKLGLYDKHIIKIASDEKIVEGIHEIIHEAQSGRSFFEIRCVSALLTVLTETARNTQLPENAVIRAVEKINLNYSSDISNSELAAMCGLSLSQFLRVFKSVTGTSPHSYIMRQRLLMAKELLHNTDYSIKRIAELVGFDDQLYFCRFFKKSTGMTPSAYKRLYSVF